MPRAAAAHARNTITRTYGRNNKRKCPSPRSDAPATESSDHEEEENRVAPEQPQGASATDEEMEDQGGEEDSGGPTTNDGNEDFHVNTNLLL